MKFLYALLSLFLPLFLSLSLSLPRSLLFSSFVSFFILFYSWYIYFFYLQRYYDFYLWLFITFSKSFSKFPPSLSVSISIFPSWFTHVVKSVFSPQQKQNIEKKITHNLELFILNFLYIFASFLAIIVFLVITGVYWIGFSRNHIFFHFSVIFLSLSLSLYLGVCSHLYHFVHCIFPSAKSSVLPLSLSL